MKLKTQEEIRKIELIAYIISTITTIILTSSSDLEIIQNVQNLLENYNIDIKCIRLIFSNIYNTDLLTSFRRETFTEEYKQLKSRYNEITYNTTKLYNEIGLSEPVSIFATYIYMYRKGYFSYNNQFLFSSNMIDFPKLQGLDVIRGRAVCRSIASFLTDIYNEMNMKSYNMMVSVKPGYLKNLKELNTIPIELEELESIFSKIIEKIAKYTPTTNHLITAVEHNNKNYIFDPTNDGFLQYKNLFEICVPYENNKCIRNNTFGPCNLIYKIVGINQDRTSMISKYQQIKKPTITTEEYEIIYLQALKFCIQNDKLFQDFFKQNENLINDIYTISENQSGMVKRMLPIIK